MTSMRLWIKPLRNDDRERNELFMTQATSIWWHALVVCPSCGSRELSWPDHTMWEGKCVKCGRDFKLDNDILRWNDTNQVTKMALLPVLARRLRNFLNPISSPLLPFRYLTQIRLERYYQRTLLDSDLARKWAGHYLDGLDLPEEVIVLDFGCGRGRNVGILNQLGYWVAGQDVKFHSWWHRLTGCGFQVTQGSSNLPWRDAVFDLVVEVEVIHYIHETQLLKHVQEIKRILKPGGYWLLLEANSKSFGARQVRSKIGRLHELDKVKELTASSGFIEISQSFEGFYAPYFPILINFIRKLCVPRQFDISDYDSWLATKIMPERRALWLLRLKKIK